jgi:hypothetical protein
VEPAKPFEKKSELTKKLNIQPGGGGPPAKLPPLAAAPANKLADKGGGLNETKNGAAYQVSINASEDVFKMVLAKLPHQGTRERIIGEGLNLCCLPASYM